MKKTKSLKIIFMGTPQFAVPGLEILKELEFADISAVITHPDKAKGRNLVVTPPPVKISAERLNLPVYQPERVSSPDFLQKLKSLECDLMIVVSFGEILSKDVLAMAKTGCINLHASLLPNYRGAAPITWALLNGEKNTGVTTFWISEKMDSGDIIMQKEIDIYPEDTRGTLEGKLSNIGAQLLKDTISAIREGTAKRIPQDKSKVTFAPKIKKEHGLINWGISAEAINNKIRAMNPWPVAHIFLKRKRIEIWASGYKEEHIHEKPGTVVLLNEEGIGIATGKGILIIKELQVEGKKRINAKDFVHGYRLNEGQVFGDAD